MRGVHRYPRYERGYSVGLTDLGDGPSQCLQRWYCGMRGVHRYPRYERGYSVGPTDLGDGPSQ